MNHVGPLCVDSPVVPVGIPSAQRTGQRAVRLRFGVARATHTTMALGRVTIAGRLSDDLATVFEATPPFTTSSTVGISHSAKPYMASSAGPVRRAPSPLPADTAISVTAGGHSPPAPPRGKDLKIQDLIKRPRNTKPVEVVPVAGDVPEARAGTLELTARLFQEPPRNTRRLQSPSEQSSVHSPQVAHHVRQARRVRTVRADRAGAAVPRPLPVASPL